MSGYKINQLEGTGTLTFWGHTHKNQQNKLKQELNINQIHKKTPVIPVINNL